MKLIVGLGNPGRIYASSRHNIGFWAVKALAKEYKVRLKAEAQCFSIAGKFSLEEEAVLLALPLTYMNLSGNAVKALLKKYRINKDNLLVVCDDLDLSFGRIKLKPAGSSGGHRGLESVINSLGTRDFPRLRVGIGRPGKATDSSEYVLADFSRKEKEISTRIMERVLDCCAEWIKYGTEKAMNVFNCRKGENQ